MLINQDSSILRKPEHIISLATGGILLRAKVKVHTFTKQDRQISDEVTTSKRAARNAGRYTKQLFADVPELRALLNDRQTWYNFVQRVTYPWDGEWGYLPTSRIVPVMAEVEQRSDTAIRAAEHVAQLDTEVHERAEPTKRQDAAHLARSQDGRALVPGRARRSAGGRGRNAAAPPGRKDAGGRRGTRRDRRDGRPAAGLSSGRP